jgi:hypothetical protein
LENDVKRIISTTITFLLAATPAAGQDLVQAVSGIDRGTIRASYATQPGTCGHDDNIQFGTSRTVINGRWNNQRCIEGPAFLQLEIRNSRVSDAEIRVGTESWPRAGGDVTDLGRLAAATTAAALLELAEDARDDAGENLVFAAVIADSAVLVGPLLRLARMDGLEEDTRKSAVFWLAHATDQDVSGHLETLAMDDGIPLDVREAAVFGLSQADGATAGPALRRIAMSEAPTELRENAVFWLGQSDDPQAVEFLTELARGSSPLAEKAVFGLSQHDSPEANAALKALVTDRSVREDVQENAIFWLGQSDDDGNVDFLREVYQELDDPDLKEKVIFSMSQVGGDDAITWLLAVAGDRDEPTDVRKNALFWAGQTEGAGDRLIALYGAVTDRDIKQQLIFVYAQADDDASLAKLMDIGRNETDHDLRENAIFWLGQSDAPEAMAFLEDLIDG